MTSDPFQRFLGVDESSDALTLLGLPRGTTDVSLIETALRNRLGRVFAHAQGRSDDAKRVRAHVRDATEALVRSLRQPPTRPAGRRRARFYDAPPLTEFDRMVLAVLIGSGGWNAESRARLVALAGVYGVSVDGLLKVVIGLCDHARSGGARLEVAQITGGGRQAPPRPMPMPDDRDAAQWLARIAPELRDRGPASTFRLALLFGLVTVIVVLLAARVLFAPAERPQVARPPRPPDASTAVERTTQAAVDRGVTQPTVGRLAEFDTMPTFLGHAVTAEAARAADECSVLAALIDLVARRLTVADEPSPAVFREWAACIRTAGIGWVLISDSTADAIEKAIFETLYAASDSPTVTDTLLAELIPPSGRFSEPVDVWRGAWNAGTLARIGSRRSLSPSVVERARIQLDLALGDDGRDLPAGFDAAAAAWLEIAAVALVERMVSGRETFDFWESWIAAQRQLGGGKRFETAIMDSIEQFLAASVDLGRPGAGASVLGRLLELADFESSRVVRERFCAFFDDEQRIGPRALWATTSMLARFDVAPWFSEDLVLPEDADWMFRRRIADRIRGRWPDIPQLDRALPAAGVMPADPVLAGRWSAIRARQGDPGEEPQALLGQLVVACRLNHAACLILAGETESAGAVLNQLELEGVPAGDATVPPVAAGRRKATGPDGAWALDVEQAGRNNDELLKLLAALRLNAGTDLGPIDAAAFVRIVYNGPRRDVRVQARSALVELFAAGPNVALEMLGQLPNAPTTDAISGTIRRYTGRLLPRARSAPWAADARLALVEHALWLLGSPQRRIDQMMEAVAQSYTRRGRCLEPRALLLAGATWRQATDGVVAAWRARVLGLVADPPPGATTASLSNELADVSRRRAARQRLAEGPLQQFVAAQLAVLDLATLAAVTQRPDLRSRAIDNIRESARRRSSMSHVLQQAVEVERALNRLWRLRFEPGRAERQET